MSRFRGLSAVRPRIEREGVIAADGGLAADTGQDAFPPAAEARHDMEGGGAETDAEIGLRRNAVDGNHRPEGGGAERNQIVRPEVVVHDADTVENRVGDQRAQLFFVPAGVGSVCHDDGQVLRREGAFVQQV